MSDQVQGLGGPPQPHQFTPPSGEDRQSFSSFLYDLPDDTQDSPTTESRKASLLNSRSQGSAADISEGTTSGSASKPQTKTRKLFSSLLNVKGASWYEKSKKFMGTSNPLSPSIVKCMSWAITGVIGGIGALLSIIPSGLNNIAKKLLENPVKHDFNKSQNAIDRIANTSSKPEIAKLFNQFKTSIMSRNKDDPILHNYNAMHLQALNISKNSDPNAKNISSDHKKEIMSNILTQIQVKLHDELLEAQDERLKKLFPDLTVEDRQNMIK
jgi:hypothetical protein